MNRENVGAPDRDRPHTTPGDAAAREHRPAMPADWWLRRRSYFLFMLRELTAPFVGAYALFLLVLAALGEEAFQAVLASPLSVIFHAAALPMALYHSVTWFNLTPKVLVLWRGEERVSPLVVAGAHYAAWIVVSLLVVGLAKVLSGE